jgi:hypothetical protein
VNMQLQQRHVDALDQAETLMFHSNFCPYLELKEMFADSTPQARRRFRSLFTDFYVLNVGGLTAAFKDRFFEILFGGDVITNGKPNFATILNELSLISRHKGDFAMPFSFVSKLVAMHQETSPIYDKHVLAFFGVKPPAASQLKQNRITWFVDFLSQVAVDYTVWAQDVRISPILSRLKSRDQRLLSCDVVRLMDFLVWKVGNQKLM